MLEQKRLNRFTGKEEFLQVTGSKTKLRESEEKKQKDIFYRSVCRHNVRGYCKECLQEVLQDYTEWIKLNNGHSFLDCEGKKLTYSHDLTSKQAEQLKQQFNLWEIEYKQTEKYTIPSIKELKNRYKNLDNELIQGYNTHKKVMFRSLTRYIKQFGFTLNNEELEDYCHRVFELWLSNSQYIHKQKRYIIVNRLPLYVPLCRIIRRLFLNDLEKESKRKAVLLKANWSLNNPQRKAFYKAYYCIEDKETMIELHNSKLLNAKQKRIMQLKLQDYKQTEIAQKLKVSPAMISKELKLIRESLKHILAS